MGPSRSMPFSSAASERHASSSLIRRLVAVREEEDDDILEGWRGGSADGEGGLVGGCDGGGRPILARPDLVDSFSPWCVVVVFVSRQMWRECSTWLARTV